MDPIKISCVIVTAMICVVIIYSWYEVHQSSKMVRVMEHYSGQITDPSVGITDIPCPVDVLRAGQTVQTLTDANRLKRFIPADQAYTEFATISKGDPPDAVYCYLDNDPSGIQDMFFKSGGVCSTSSMQSAAVQTANNINILHRSHKNASNKCIMKIHPNYVVKDMGTIQDSRAIAWLYTLPDYGGNMVRVYDPRSYTVDWVRSQGLYETVKSVKLKVGYMMSMYSADDQSYEIVNGDHITDLGAFKNKMIRFDIEPAINTRDQLERAIVIVYEHAFFQGKKVAYDTEGTFKLSDSGMDKKVSSVVISKEGYQVTLYKGGDGTGDSVKILASSTLLEDFNDQASSITIAKIPPPPPPAAAAPASTAACSSSPSASSLGHWYKGQDLKNDATKALKMMQTETGEACAQACVTEPQCNSMSWDNTGSKTCWLKADIGTLFADQSRDSWARIYIDPSEAAAAAYEHDNYAGRVVVFPQEGTYDMAYLGDMNDKISSIKVKKGYKVMLYNDPKQTGRNETFLADTPRMPNGMNDEVSSVRIEKADRGEDVIASLYELPNYKGRRMDIKVLGGTNVEEVLDNRIQSVQIKPNHRITLFEHHGYGKHGDAGRTRDIYKDTPQLQQGWANIVSSLFVEQIPANLYASLYEHAFMIGRRIDVTTPTGDIANENNDSVSSVWVAPDHRLTLFRDVGQTGATQEYGEGMYDNIMDLGSMNDEASSWRVENVKTLIATLYEHENYQGRKIDVHAVTNGNNITITRESGMHDKISSLTVKPGYRITLFVDEGGQGERQDFYSDTPYLRNAGVLDDRASSYAVDDVKNLLAAMYDHPHATGARIEVWEETQVGNVGRHDVISSVYVKQGYKLTLFYHDNWQGHSQDFFGYVPSLEKVGRMDDETSSYKLTRA